MIINAILKPRFVGGDTKFNTKYEYFFYYMNNIGFGEDNSKSIYKDNFNSAINSYLKLAAADRNNLFKLENDLQNTIRINSKKNLNVAGLIAKNDAAKYTLAAINYGKSKIIEQVNLKWEQENENK